MSDTPLVPGWRDQVDLFVKYLFTESVDGSAPICDWSNARQGYFFERVMELGARSEHIRTTVPNMFLKGMQLYDEQIIEREMRDDSGQTDIFEFTE